MPILPLDDAEPFAATLGVMLYPGPSEPNKAGAFATRFLHEPFKRFRESGRSLSYETLASIYADGSGLAEAGLDDLSQRCWAGTATGELVKVYFLLTCGHESLASWNNAIKVAKAVWAQDRCGSRTQIWSARSQFLSVAHLWGAWSIRRGRFFTKPDVGYDGWTDFQFFLAEAEILRDWGQHWRQRRRKAEPPLPPDVHQVPDDWHPPERQPGWPQTGMIPLMALSDSLLARLRPAGRPRKTH